MKKVSTKNLGNLVIKEVSKQLAKDLIIKNHYSHKWNNAGFGVYNFGMFRDGTEDDESKCLGVASYGYMKNSKAKIFTHPNPNAWMCELNRMWISDELGKNAESLLIAHSIKQVKKLDSNIVAIQSFADGRLGCGTIYKASNFKYYGKHETIFLQHKLTGEVTHQQNLTNSTSKKAFVRNNIAYLLGDYDMFKVNTYRYIYPLCKHFEFKTEPITYPEYSKGSRMFDWDRNRDKIKARVNELLNCI